MLRDARRPLRRVLPRITSPPRWCVRRRRPCRQETDAGLILHERVQPFADQIDWNGITAFGHARMYLGLLAGVLGNHEEADRHLAFACEFHETNSMLLSAARAQLGWAEALTARGVLLEHVAAARALVLSREHGYGIFELRAAALVETESAAGT